MSSPSVLSTNHYFVPFKPSTSVLVGLLTATFSLTFLFLLYIKHCNDGNTFVSHSSFQPSHVRKNSGVDRDVLDSLPTFRFESLKGQKNGLDCAVCLGKFEDCEVLRLLPECKHAFHMGCVDTWLFTHSTCPLCRYRVEPDGVVDGLDVEKGQDNDVSRGENENAGTTSFRRSLDSVVEHGLELEHRIIVSPCSNLRGRVHQRWSDFQPRDALYLTSDMVTWKAHGGGGGRRRSDSSSNVVGEVMENDGVMKNVRSLSKVTGIRSVQGLLLLF
ncbi:RING-H2 finger protein ATL43-like [Cajanus cajan]|uniref:RING-H2 finger protein ATL43-like n=1 Tax=Cajanus cajan TaxID=3821 RepID=UPI00098DCECE|nr:RING-H2 finger protein ATL43-like [Cajanus cajan]